MKFYNERAKKVYPGLSFTAVGFDLRESKYLDHVKQVVAHADDGESYYMLSSFCRFVASRRVDLDSLIGTCFEIVKREIGNGRMGLYVEGGR